VSTSVVASVLATTLALCPSVLYATLGEIVDQRTGIVNLGIEGVMLVGAAAGFAVGVVTGSSALGLLGGVAAGIAFNLLFAVLVVSRGTNQLATGFALYFLGAGISTLIGSEYVGRSVGGLASVHVPLPGAFDKVLNQDVLVWLMVPAAFACWWLLFRTRWGLHLRAVGEDRDSAFAAGLHPSSLQYQALIVAGGFSGLAGAQLAISYTKTWQDWMTAGRGFIAIVIVMFALWHPVRAVVGALLFGASTAIGLQLQAQGSGISPFVLDMLPYVVTIAVVLIWARARAFTVPAGLREVFTGTAK
jgi:general nucleoside transport system permease protein